MRWLLFKGVSNVNKNRSPFFFSYFVISWTETPTHSSCFKHPDSIKTIASILNWILFIFFSLRLLPFNERVFWYVISHFPCWLHFHYLWLCWEVRASFLKWNSTLFAHAEAHAQYKALPKINENGNISYVIHISIMSKNVSRQFFVGVS